MDRVVDGADVALAGVRDGRAASVGDDELEVVVHSLAREVGQVEAAGGAVEPELGRDWGAVSHLEGVGLLAAGGRRRDHVADGRRERLDRVVELRDGVEEVALRVAKLLRQAGLRDPEHLVHRGRVAALGDRRDRVVVLALGDGLLQAERHGVGVAAPSHGEDIGVLLSEREAADRADVVRVVESGSLHSGDSVLRRVPERTQDWKADRRRAEAALPLHREGVDLQVRVIVCGDVSAVGQPRRTATILNDYIENKIDLLVPVHKGEDARLRVDHQVGVLAAAEQLVVDLLRATVDCRLHVLRLGGVERDLFERGLLNLRDLDRVVLQDLAGRRRAASLGDLHVLGNRLRRTAVSQGRGGVRVDTHHRRGLEAKEDGELAGGEVLGLERVAMQAGVFIKRNAGDRALAVRV